MQTTVCLHLHHPAHVWDVEAAGRDVRRQQTACCSQCAGITASMKPTAMSDTGGTLTPPRQAVNVKSSRATAIMEPC
jgi:hypothetical protein